MDETAKSYTVFSLIHGMTMKFHIYFKLTSFTPVYTFVQSIFTKFPPGLPGTV